MEAVVFIGHGSRSKQSNDSFISLVKKASEKMDSPIIKWAFLENAKPSIQDALRSCTDNGANEIIVIPVLMLPGVHANEDIPKEIESFKVDYPHVLVLYGSTIGVDSIIVDILKDRLKVKGFTGKHNEKIILVGHGSREREAKIELEKLALKLKHETKTNVVPCTLKVQPYFEETIEKLIDTKKLYVVPLFLFTGRFINVISETILKHKEKTKGNYILCDPVGFEDDLAALLATKIGKTRINPLLSWERTQ